MAVKLNATIREAISDPDSVKVLASVDRHGTPHVVAKGSLSVDENGQIYYWELLEGSQTNRNLTYSLWMNRTVAINVITKEKKSYQIKGVPVRSLVAGHEYEKAYIKAQERNTENDLAAVYFIEPTEVYEETYSIRQNEESAEHPLYIHLDRLAKEG